MDKILKKELELNKSMRAAIAIGLSFFLTVSIIFCVILYSSTKTSVQEQAIRNFTNLCQLNEDSLNQAFQNRQKLLETIAVRLMNKDIYEPTEILNELRDFESAYGYYHMGVVDQSMTLYRTNGEVIDVSDIETTETVWDDQPHITDSYLPPDNDEYMVNMFSCPVFRNGELECVIVATSYAKDLATRMNLETLDGKGFTYLMNGQSEIVVYPHRYENQEYNRLMAFVNQSEYIIPDESGDQFFMYDGERYYAHFEKLDINDWYLMSCARESDVFAEAQHITRSSFAAIGMMWAFIAVAVVTFLYAMYRFLERLRYNYFYDELLGIRNVNALAAYFKRVPGEMLSRMYLVVFDVDKFKEFNYIYGNDEGDRLLRYIVQVFQEELPDLYLFRQEADCFITLDPAKDPEEMRQKMQKIHDRYIRDIQNGVIQPFDTSSGIRKVDPDVPMRQLISDAIIARDAVKGNHLRHHAFYDESARDRRLSYMEMESAFSTALQNQEFQVYYQPKYNMVTGEIIGAEALARWVKEDGTIISPALFVPCFEASRQIAQLDQTILREVCSQMKEMEVEGIEVKPVSVNLSRIHLQQTNILPRIQEIVTASGIRPGNLSFEITERVLEDENIPLQEITDGLRQIGCKVAMDDYGIGASGPKALAADYFDIVKLDKSLVDDIGNSHVEAVIEMTIHLAEKLGLDVLAEGVEELEQAERLVEMGCLAAQGFYYSRPIPEGEYRELLRADRQAEDMIDPKSGNHPNVDPAYHSGFSEDFRTALDTTEAPIYIIDAETFEIIYCNQTMKKNLGYDPLGELCHKAIRGLDTYCPGCVVRKIVCDGINEATEYHLPSGSWFLVKASPLRWRGRDLYKLTCTDITRQKKLEEELRLSSKEYGAVVYQSTSGILRYDITTGVGATNVDLNLNRIEEQRVPDYLNVVLKSGVLDPDSLPEFNEMFGDIHAGAPSRGYDLHLTLPDGNSLWCHADYTLIDDEEGRPYRVVVSFHDNTEQREKEEAYQRWNARLNAIMNDYTAYMEINLTSDTIEAEGRYGEWEKNSGGRCYSTSLERMADTGVYEEDQVNFRRFFHRERLLGQFLAGNREGALEYRTILEGRLQWYKAEIQMISDPFTGDVKASVLVSNVDLDLRERENLMRRAERDIMTGLYNHATAEKLMRQAMELSTGERLCLMIIDLDDLRIINSTLGHPEGDRALKALAAGMKAQFRKSDIMGRIGGDEFLVLLRNAPEIEELRPALMSFMNRIGEIRIGALDDRPVHASIGCTMGTAGVDSFDTLYKQADLALFYTKAMGKNGFNVYETELEKREFTYHPGSSATLSSVDSLGSMEIRKLLQAVSVYCPLVISANLTKNTYYMMEYTDFITQCAKDEGNYDELIEAGYQTFHPEDREEFRACFSRESLLQSYAKNQFMVEHTGRQYGDDGIYRRVKTVAIIMKEEESDNICEISFSHML